MSWTKFGKNLKRQQPEWVKAFLTAKESYTPTISRKLLHVAISEGITLDSNIVDMMSNYFIQHKWYKSAMNCYRLHSSEKLLQPSTIQEIIHIIMSADSGPGTLSHQQSELTDSKHSITPDFSLSLSLSRKHQDSEGRALHRARVCLQIIEHIHNNGYSVSMGMISCVNKYLSNSLALERERERERDKEREREGEDVGRACNNNNNSIDRSNSEIEREREKERMRERLYRIVLHELFQPRVYFPQQGEERERERECVCVCVCVCV